MYAKSGDGNTRHELAGLDLLCYSCTAHTPNCLVLSCLVEGLVRRHKRRQFSDLIYLQIYVVIFFLFLFLL